MALLGPLCWPLSIGVAWLCLLSQLLLLLMICGLLLQGCPGKLHEPTFPMGHDPEEHVEGFMDSTRCNWFKWKRSKAFLQISEGVSSDTQEGARAWAS